MLWEGVFVSGDAIGCFEGEKKSHMLFCSFLVAGRFRSGVESGPGVVIAGLDSMVFPLQFVIAKADSDRAILANLRRFTSLLYSSATGSTTMLSRDMTDVIDLDLCSNSRFKARLRGDSGNFVC